MHFYIISFITNNSLLDVEYNNIKLNIALISAFYAVLIDIFIYNIHNPTMNKYIYLPLIIIIISLIIIYRNQGFITDNDYLKDIIENDSMAIFTSNIIKDKTSNKEIKELSNKIILLNKKEIEEIKNIIKDSKTINKIINSEDKKN
jgi:hypothetical protein